MRLAAVVEVPKQPFRVKYRSEFRPYSLDAQKSGRFPRCLRRLANDQGISLGFYSLDLCQQQLETIELSADFRF